MKMKPLGVWFSLALVILAASGWAGWKLGGRAAAYWFRHQLHQAKGQLSAAERIQLESTLEALYAAQTAKIYALVSVNDPVHSKQVLLSECSLLQDLKRNPSARTITPLVDYELGTLYLGIEMTDEQEENAEEANMYMKSAQAVFQSLGWKDYSPENLRTVARRQFDHLKLPAKINASRP
jgi:hypothetical protein